MRVRELLAANAFCLLALTLVGCKAVEQPVGEYSAHVRPGKPTDSPRPAGSRSEPAAGRDAVPLSDAGMSIAEIEDASLGSTTDGGTSTGLPNTWLPPMLPVDAGPSTTPSNVACTVVEAQPRRLDMYLMVDSNIAVSASSTWEVMTDGITGFVNDQRSSGTGVGIRYFGVSCDPSDYATPVVEVDVLPKNANAIIASTRQRRWTASPMLPALEGAIDHQRDRTPKYPLAKQVVVLVSDGFSQDLTCIYSTQMLADAARAGLVATPSIETHVLAVGVNTDVSQPLDQLIEFVGAFNAIANAGGSGSAVTTSITGDAAGFSEALQHVRRNAMPCEFAAPSGVALGEFGVAPFTSPTQQLPRVTNERGCNNQQGWFYAVESLPTPVTLCPATCDWFRAADDHAIGLLTGCVGK